MKQRHVNNRKQEQGSNNAMRYELVEVLPDLHSSGSHHRKVNL